MNNSSSAGVAVILVAAGRGRRLGGEIPKQYIPLDGVCSLRRCAEIFLSVEGVGYILPVIHPDDAELCADALGGLADERLMAPVLGGETRAASVRNGLEALETHAPFKVLIHDAARPFVSERIIAEVIATLDEVDGAFAALPVVDALWSVEDGAAVRPVPRDGLWRAQTPQGFDFKKILGAHRGHDGSGADDVAVAHEAGLGVRVVPGSERNFKITTQADLERALRELALGKA
jgi:2-C-methyl-D-erythritol 4-phosphate cytidylyltransferase